MDDRTPAWWSTRILLGIGLVATLIVVAGSIVTLIPEPMFGRDGVWGLPPAIARVLLAAPAVVGLAWQVRIFTGSRDEPPAWRHRDR